MTTPGRGSSRMRRLDDAQRELRLVGYGTLAHECRMAYLDMARVTLALARIETDCRTAKTRNPDNTLLLRIAEACASMRAELAAIAATGTNVPSDSSPRVDRRGDMQ